jgi:hypothetical protein
VITPRLLRRALWRGLQWRLLLVWWGTLLLPTVIAGLPLMAFFDRHLGHSTRAGSLLARLDGSALLELVRLLGENGSGPSIGFGLGGAALVLLTSAPFAAGAAVCAARTDDQLDLRSLSAGAAGLYGRMLRTLLCGLLLLAAAAALAAGAFALANHANQKLLSETIAERNWLLASLPSALAFFIAHLLVDTARAQFAADSSRRSAVLATWAAVRLFSRRPVRVALVGLAGSIAAVAPAAAFMLLRFQLTQSTAAMVALAWLLGQGAQLAVGFGRNTRLFALAELSRADAAFRSRPRVPQALAVHLVVPAPDPDPLAAAPLSKGQGPAI